MEHECKRCGRPEPEVRLRTCRTCHSYVCEEDLVERSGADFCTDGCAEFFFRKDFEADEDD